eukprot:Awhi_evm1s13071
MADNADCSPILCKLCTAFYGNPMQENLCSSCYQKDKGTNDKLAPAPIGTKTLHNSTPLSRPDDLFRQDLSNTVLPSTTKSTPTTPTSSKKDEEDEENAPTRKVQKNIGRCFKCRAKVSLVHQVMNKCRC